MSALRIALEALNSIAAWSDGREVDCTFDSPADARAARKALAAINKENGMTCLITGCALIDPTHDRSVWGDLHMIGGAYVFNACLNAYEAAWQTPMPGVLDTTPAMTIDPDLPPGYVFERRGMIVVSPMACSFNKAAQARMPK